MPKRSKSHQLESASILALQTRLPPQWVFREEHPDYGIDGSIEVFAGDGNATGLRCLVQVKSTAKSSARPYVRIRRQTGDYYRSLEGPVLIVFYQADRDRLLVRWFHEFDPFYGGLGEKEITFYFTEEHAWSDATAARIETDLRTLRVLRTGALPLPIAVQISVLPDRVGTISRGRVELAIRRELRKLRNLFQEEGESAALHIRVELEKVVASFRGRHSVTLHFGEDEKDAETFARDVLVLIAVATGRAGDHGLASTIGARVAGRSRLMRIPETALHLAHSIVRSQQIGLLLHITEQLMEDEESRPTADALMMLAIVEGRDDETFRSAVEGHLRKRVQREEAAGDSVQIGTVHYNLANWLRGQRRRREALRHYRRAAEAHPAYAERDYYYRDLGGLLFGEGFYRAAAKYYAEGVRRGGPNDWKALEADALLFAGSYDEARDAFARYLETEEQPDAGWVLKRAVLDVVAEFELPRARRRTRDAQDLLSADATGGEASARMALELDPLCIDAWLRLGAALSQRQDHEFAATAAMVAAILANGDARLWAQAFVLSGHMGEPGIEEMIAFAALDAVKEDFTEAVLEFVGQSEFSAKDQEAIADALGALEGEHERTRRPDTYELRFAGEGAAYEKIVVPLEVPFDACSESDAEAAQ